MLSRKLQVLLNTIAKLLRKRAYRRVQDIIRRVHLADLAVAFRFLDDDDQEILFGLLENSEQRAELLENLDQSISDRLIADYSVDDIVDIIQYMSDDDAADLIQDLGEEKVKAILGRMKKDDREDLQGLIGYDEDTAGGLMTTDFIAVPATYTCRQVLQAIQESGEEAEMVFYIYALDEEDRLAGVASLRELVQAQEDTLFSDLMETDITKVRPDRDQEDVARMIARYDLLAVPVVDEENHVIGIITVDDVIDVIREEDTEDILKLVGADEELLEDYSLKTNVLSRLPWLLATWIGGIFVMHLIGYYEEKLSGVVALTAFFPVILGMSGNVGQQSATIIVRGLAIGKVDGSRFLSTVGIEAMTGLCLGLIYGAAIGTVAQIQFGTSVGNIAIVVGVSQASGMLIAALMGGAVPMALTRLKIDPAIATGPLVTTSMDLVSMYIYMAMATLLIF